jgi:hypothetical protein
VPAPPLLVSCLTRLYVAGRTDEGDWRKILDAIETTQSQFQQSTPDLSGNRSSQVPGLYMDD